MSRWSGVALTWSLAACVVHDPASVATVTPVPAAAPAPVVVAVQPPAPAQVAIADPAGIAGRWSYETMSNCGTVVGTGVVSFEWDPQSNTYKELGTVHWPDSGSTIDWWGRDRFDPPTATIHGEISNSLGDSVRGTWRIEPGTPPRRLTIRWAQTNGCYGEGIATR